MRELEEAEAPWKCMGDFGERASTKDELKVAERVVGRNLVWPAHQPSSQEELMKMLQGAWLCEDGAMVINGSEILECKYWSRVLLAGSDGGVKKRNFKTISKSSIAIEDTKVTRKVIFRRGGGLALIKPEKEDEGKSRYTTGQYMDVHEVTKIFIGKWEGDEKMIGAKMEFSTEPSKENVPWIADKNVEEFIRKVFQPKVFHSTPLTGKATSGEWILFTAFMNVDSIEVNMAFRRFDLKNVIHSITMMSNEDKSKPLSEVGINRVGFNYIQPDPKNVYKPISFESYRKTSVVFKASDAKGLRQIILRDSKGQLIGRLMGEVELQNWDGKDKGKRAAVIRGASEFELNQEWFNKTNTEMVKKMGPINDMRRGVNWVANPARPIDANSSDPVELMLSHFMVQWMTEPMVLKDPKTGKVLNTIPPKKCEEWQTALTASVPGTKFPCCLTIFRR